MQTVKVRLRKPTRVFSFICPEIDLRRGDACVVRSDRGMEFGTCVVPSESCPESMRELVKMTVLRKANQNDEVTFLKLQAAEEDARRICAEKIQKHRLPMKLVDVEYTFDKHKVVFYFTADDRVDFRQLVRDLAQDLKTRIELRHIQVRDEAKLVGGIALCGRELCCATWMRDFKPISMKMAKRQNLSLNPTKISGQCGRLLCCLSYENSQYDKRKKIVITDDAPLDAAADADLDADELYDREASMVSMSFFSPLGMDVSAREDDLGDEEYDEEGGAETTGGELAVPSAVSGGAPRNGGPRGTRQGGPPQSAESGSREEGASRPRRKRRRRRRPGGASGAESGGGGATAGS